MANAKIVFVPSLGDFFSTCFWFDTTNDYDASFRPLSRGLFFNKFCKNIAKKIEACFRPLSRGLFFNTP